MTRTFVTLAVLTLAAGYADAVAFFGLGVFTANMTGNTVLLGGAFAQALLPQLHFSVAVAPLIVSLVCFVFGALLSAVLLRRETRRPPWRTIAVVFTMALLLVAAAAIFRVGGGARLVPCVALLSTVMGLQSVVAVRAGIPGVSTTYVTGTLVTAMIDFFGDVDDPHRREQGRPNALTWVLYLVGALLGAAALAVLGERSLWPVAVVVALLLPVV